MEEGRRARGESIEKYTLDLFFFQSMSLFACWIFRPGFNSVFGPRNEPSTGPNCQITTGGSLW